VTTRYLLLILLILNHFALRCETVEEVVAVVGKTPILASDLALAELVLLVDREADETPSDHRSRLLDARIRLELQFRDLEESGTLYRLDLDLPDSRSTLLERAGGDQGLTQRLAGHGLTTADLDELSLRIAAANAYIEQRLRPRVSVSLEELQAAYQKLVVEEAEAAGQTTTPLSAVRDQLHQLVVERKLNSEIERWLSSAAERHQITRFRP
jgi:hypothetical protein